MEASLSWRLNICVSGRSVSNNTKVASGKGDYILRRGLYLIKTRNSEAGTSLSFFQLRVTLK